jgi:hypothetical protein
MTFGRPGAAPGQARRGVKIDGIDISTEARRDQGSIIVFVPANDDF